MGLLLNRRQFLAGVGAVAAARPGIAGPKSTSFDPWIPSLPEVEAAMLSNSVPGVSMTVEGKIVRTLHIGVRGRKDIDDPELDAVGPDTLFQCASCSKTVTALVVLALVRDGVLSLDRPVNLDLGDWELTGPGALFVTPALLLSHTAGTNVSGFSGFPALSQRVPTLDEVLNGVAPANNRRIRVTDLPNSIYSYSGGGFTVLQKLIESVTGERFASAAERLVLRPLGMARSTFLTLPGDASDFALAHDGDGNVVPSGFNIYAASAAAGLWTTSFDLSRVARAIIRSFNGKEGAFLPQDLAQRMLTVVRNSAGLGLFLYGDYEFRHSGINMGYRALLFGNVGTGLAGAVLTNGANGDQLYPVLQGLI